MSPSDKNNDINKPFNPPVVGDNRVVCSACLGISIYTRRMMAMQELPACMGIRMQGHERKEEVERVKRQSNMIHEDNFVQVAIGTTLYTQEWLDEKKFLPSVHGLELHMIMEEEEMSAEEALERMERRKRQKHQKKQPGKTTDTDTDTEDDPNPANGPRDQDDNGGISLANEQPPAFPFQKPEYPPKIPASISFDELFNKTFEWSKKGSMAMYNFWDRQIDGFEDRYVAFCKKMVLQMEKQVKIIPKTLSQVLKDLQDKSNGRK